MHCPWNRRKSIFWMKWNEIFCMHVFRGLLTACGKFKWHVPKNGWNKCYTTSAINTPGNQLLHDCLHVAPSGGWTFYCILWHMCGSAISLILRAIWYIVTSHLSAYLSSQSFWLDKEMWELVRHLYYINICVLRWMFILIRILCNTIEYHCINMVLYKLINIYLIIINITVFRMVLTWNKQIVKQPDYWRPDQWYLTVIVDSRTSQR